MNSQSRHEFSQLAKQSSYENHDASLSQAHDPRCHQTSASDNPFRRKKRVKTSSTIAREESERNRHRDHDFVAHNPENATTQPTGEEQPSLHHPSHGDVDHGAPEDQATVWQYTSPMQAFRWELDMGDRFYYISQHGDQDPTTTVDDLDSFIADNTDPDRLIGWERD